jgi:hypothetical protein
VAKDKLRGKSRANQRDLKPIKSQSPSYVLEGLVRFSFKFYHPNHPVFHCKDRGPEYFHSLLERLKTLSLMRVSELTHAKPTSATRFHRIDWDRDNVSVKTFGIKGWEEYDEDAWQFSISANEHGRVHGFLIANVFYVVWLDPKHKLYPGKA